MIYNNITLAQKVSRKDVFKKIKELMKLKEYSHNGVTYKRDEISGEWIQQ